MKAIISEVAQRILAWYYVGYILVFCQLHRKQNIVIALGARMGDVLFSLAYASSIHNDNKETLFLCSEETAWIAEMFELKNSMIVPVRSKVVNHMVASYICKPTNFLLQRELSKNLYITNALMYFPEKDLWNDRCGSMLSILKDKVFRCNRDYPIQRPIVPFCDVNVSIPEKAVLISPSSVTSNLIADSEWEAIIEWLNRNGYKLFTNCASEKEKELKGTKKIVLDMISMYNIIDQFDLVIGIRSGFQDFIVDRARNIISINSGNMYPNFTLTQWGIGAHVREFRYKKETFLEDIVNNVHDLHV